MTTESTKHDRTLIRVLVVAALLIAGVVTVFLLGRLLATAVTAAPVTTTIVHGVEVTVEVPNGASARSIAALMEEAGVVPARDLSRFVEQQGVASQLKPGMYRLETGMRPEDVATRLVEGPDVFEQSVIVLEGVTVASAIESLAEQTGTPVEDFAVALRDGLVTSALLPAEAPEGVDELARWEGLLYPARYEIRQDTPAREILQMMADETVHRISDIDSSRFEKLGVDTYEMLIVASLIQREAGVEEDRPLIASVIYNRLEMGMPLQIDATVVYALGGSPGRVLAEDLKIDSPWNTYLIPGLPPTPIGTVQIESALAAANPATTGYLFYVLVSQDGRHGFSETYAGHQAKIEQAKADGVLP
ncbi:MAG: endolytic transglycosylase MltG [Acidimicrobiia bacterium]|nr:MAG: endolytic transglycosylase MltG [Acidimicrobiia bacterium]